MRAGLLFLAFASAVCWSQKAPGRATDEQVSAWFRAGQRAHSRGDLARASGEYEKVVRARPEMAEARSNLGVVYYMQGRYAEALSAFEAALQRKPGLFAPLLFSGMSRARMRQYEKAVLILEKALSMEPRDRQALLYLGLSLAGVGRENEAAAHFQRLVELDPKDVEALYLAGKNDLELSVASFEKVQALEPNGFFHLRLLAALDEAQGKTPGALRARYEQIIAARPSYPNLRWTLAKWLVRAGDSEAAAAILAQEIELNPHHAPALELLAELSRDAEAFRARARTILEALPATDQEFARLLDQDAARGVGLLNTLLESESRSHPRPLDNTLGKLHTRVELTPEDDWALEVYVRSRIEQGELQRVRADLVRLTGRNPGRPAVWFWLGETYRSMSLQAHEQLVALDPAGYRTHLLAAEVFESSHQTENAIRQYRTALAAAPGVPGIHYRLGLLLVEKRELAEAVVELEKELDVDPYEVMAHVRLGEIHAYERRPERAIPHLKKAIEQHPGIAAAYSALGRAYLVEGNAAEAAKALEKSIELMPDNQHSRYQLARAYQQLGRKADADRELAAFRKLLRARTLPERRGLLESETPEAAP